MHFLGFVETEDMNIVSGKTKFTSMRGYCSSKLAQVPDFSHMLMLRGVLFCKFPPANCFFNFLLNFNYCLKNPARIADQI